MTDGLNPGQFRMHDKFSPALKQGMHSIGLDIFLPSELGLGVHSTVENDRHFEVTGPRWTIPITDVHSVRPGVNQDDADVDCVLPMFVSGRRTLPWERSLDPVEGTSSDHPWVALLLFTEEELTQGGELGIFKGDKRLKLFGQTNGHAGIFDHKVGDSEFLTKMGLDRHGIHSNFQVDAIKVSDSILSDVTPYLNELPLLVNAREVSTVDKELCGEDEDGWFSVVCCNRLPRDTSTVYHACLVSLEGRTNESWYPEIPTAIADPESPKYNREGMTMPAFPKTSTTTSLILLHHWSFKTNDTGGDFSSRMESLRLRIRDSVDPDYRAGTLAPRADVVGSDSVILEPYIFGNQSIPGVGETGHILLEQVDETGEVNSALYRGPFSPVRTYKLGEDSEGRLAPYQTADAARRWMEDLGMEDISLAAAFEVGRLLALSDPGFLRDMARLRREKSTQNRLDMTFNVLSERFGLLDVHKSEMNLQTLTRSEMYQNINKLDIVISPMIAALRMVVEQAEPVESMPSAAGIAGDGPLDGPGGTVIPDTSALDMGLRAVEDLPVTDEGAFQDFDSRRPGGDIE